MSRRLKLDRGRPRALEFNRGEARRELLKMIERNGPEVKMANGDLVLFTSLGKRGWKVSLNDGEQVLNAANDDDLLDLVITLRTGR